MAQDFIDKRHKFDVFKTRMRQLNGSSTKIGYQESEKHKSRDTDEMSDMVEIGSKHEFGSKEENIPQRSHIRTTTDEQRMRVNRKIQEGYSRILMNTSTPAAELEKVGEFMESKIKKKITDIRLPPNSPATILAKGSDNPLIDTGQMRASVRHVEEGI